MAFFLSGVGPLQKANRWSKVNMDGMTNRTLTPRKMQRKNVFHSYVFVALFMLVVREWVDIWRFFFEMLWNTSVNSQSVHQFFFLRIKAVSWQDINWATNLGVLFFEAKLKVKRENWWRLEIEKSGEYHAAVHIDTLYSMGPQNLPF